MTIGVGDAENPPAGSMSAICVVAAAITAIVPIVPIVAVAAIAAIETLLHGGRAQNKSEIGPHVR